GGDAAGVDADLYEQKPKSQTTATGTSATTDSTTSTTTAPAPAPVSSPTTTPSGSTTVSDRVPLGVNLEGLEDYARLQPFVDMMRTARAWGSASEPWNATVATDALGWPTTDAGVVVALVSQDAGDSLSTYKYLQPGTYSLRFTGKATVTPAGSTGVSVANYAYDAATNRSRADVVVGPNAPGLMLSFQNTAGGVRDVSLRRPGYPDNQTFTNEFMEAVAPFGVVRLMDFLATNGNPVRTWAERTTPASGTQTGPKGAAYEYAIDLANELGKDIWINIPVGADDDFVRQLAMLLNARLAPGRAVYVEYSNELWNSIFAQTKQNRDAAIAEAIAGDTTLTSGTQCTQAQFDAISGNCNPYWAGYHRIGKRTVRISQIFSEVFGPGAMNTRARIVFATQFANPAIAEQVLKNMATYRAPPASVIYGVATAPYFLLSKATAASLDATQDQILTELDTTLRTTIEPYFAAGVKQNGVFVRGAYTGGNYTGASHKALADYYGIKSLAYEGGPDLLQDPANSATKLGANRDARMGALLKSEIAQWIGCGNDLYMHFTLTSKWDKYGYWGLTNDPLNLATAKYTAARDLAQSPRSAYTTCR
ncbi:MAG TPA: hypothetical protein VGD76_13760, partial [Ramlibacter sp.]